MKQSIEQLIKREGWETTTENGKKFIIAKGKKFKFNHPAAIHLKFYRDETNPEVKFQHMKAAHDYIWPNEVKTWNYWTKRRFRNHCKHWKYISYAGGANCAKSYDTAKIVVLFWLANPRKRGVVVASTTLESVTARIWGYVTKFLSKMEVKFPFQYLGGQSPKILFPTKRSANEIRDTIHGMFAIAAKKGNDESAISNWIGRHPDDALMLILDEATDLPVSIVNALPNLDAVGRPFQCVTIGNSNSKSDLHGSLSTPKCGWENIDPMTTTEWETTQPNGLCLFFNAYESPAIHEPDPIKKELLSKFLIGAEKLKDKELTLGKDSDGFWRFVIGYWKTDSTESTIISKQFIDDYRVFRRAEWSGLYPLSVCSGLDPAFSTGGDDCILRLAILGQTVDGSIVLDYRDEELLFKIEILATTKESADIQIAKQVIKILDRYGASLQNLCIDANGQGRALGSVIQLQKQLQGGGLYTPTKIYSTKGGENKQKSFDVTIKTAYELWFAIRDFVQHSQICGLDILAIQQLTSRLVKLEGKKQVLESKKEYKTRMNAISPLLAHSPDNADGAALCLQSAIMHFGFYPGQKREIINPVKQFAHDKAWAFAAEKKEEAQKEKEKFNLEANFTGDLGEIKLPFS